MHASVPTVAYVGAWGNRPPERPEQNKKIIPNIPNLDDDYTKFHVVTVVSAQNNLDLIYFIKSYNYKYSYYIVL